MRLIYYWNILLLVFLCACGAEVGERDNPFDGGADMTDYERDVSGWSKGSEGEAKHGNISNSCYVYENKIWRVGNNYDCSLGFGGCIVALQDSLRQSDFWYKCDTLMWRRASAIETDTAGWGEVKDGEVRAGQVNKTIYYIYEKSRNAWRVATTLEFDTYDYTNNKDWAIGKDGDSKVGSVNANNCYVYENKAWRNGNASDCSLKLRGCTALRQDTVGKGSDKKWHICDSKSWRNATTYEKDTFGWKNDKDGEIKKGNVTDTVYVFDKTAWRVSSAVEAKLGGCVSAIADSVGKVGSTYYICRSNVWADASALEYDTYKWTAGKDGDCKVGSVNAGNCYVYENKAWRSGNMSDCSLGLRGCTALRQDTVGKGSDKVWYICDSRSWRNATTYDKDTFDWKNGTDGEIKKGNVTDSMYVFDKTSWRTATDVEAKLGGCVSAIADSVGKVGSTYYICTPRKWVLATVLQYDTYKHACTEFGQIVHGNVNQEYAYFCYGNEWKRFYGNESVSYGKLIDNRDGAIYRTVKIGEQIWMAENLNYEVGGNGLCYQNDLDNCKTYGRLYSGIIGDESQEFKNHCSSSDTSFFEENIQWYCPEGWHMPSIDDFKALYEKAGSNSKSLQAKGFKNWPKATDELGFSAVPSGYMDDPGAYSKEPSDLSFGLGSFSIFWLSTISVYYEKNGETGYFPEAYCYKRFYSAFLNEKGVSFNHEDSCFSNFAILFSVRCIKDKE